MYSVELVEKAAATAQVGTELHAASRIKTLRTAGEFSTALLAATTQSFVYHIPGSLILSGRSCHRVNCHAHGLTLYQGRMTKHVRRGLSYDNSIGSS